MEKQLIIDSMLFQITPQQIKQSLQQNNGKFLVKGILSRANQKNQNGRIYQRKILTDSVNRYIQNNVNQKMALGQLDHSDSPIINLKNVSHNITKVF